MPHKRGGRNRGDTKKNNHQRPTITTKVQNPSQSQTTDQNQDNMKQRFEITPLISETENLTKVLLNNLIKNRLP